MERDLKAIRAELAEVNQSAVANLDEGFKESLTLHPLGVFARVGRSLKTTNVIESINSIEPRLRRLLGYRHLPQLRAAIQRELGITPVPTAT